jgi:hypothetical protein
VIHEDAHAPTPSSGFVVPDQRLAFLNRDGEFQFDVWDLDDSGALDSPRDPPQFHKDQDDWVGFYVIGAAKLVGGRVLVGLTIYNPRPTHGLCLYSPAADGFRWMGFVDADIRDPSRVFEHRVLPGDRAIVISYSGRTRKAAEIYHNYYNHVYAFTAQRAGGVEVAQVGIDTGNIRDWDVEGTTMLLHTVDDRDPKKPHESYWSLDLRRVLGT